MSKKLRNVADVKLSNVDKKTMPNEREIKLCNYTDVYKNWSIRNDMIDSFMVATCNENEFDNFSIKKGQVAITKDSEKRDDIGISAYIKDDFQNVVCGYHLSLITPFENELNGEYLNYLLYTERYKKYFENNASGSGQRFSLSIDCIKDIPLDLPDLPTQTAIARVLSSLDDKIELNNKINKELEELAKTIYDYWFVQNAEEKWERKSLYDIATFTNGLACQKFRPKGKDFYKVIKIREMRDGFTKDTELVDVNIPEKVIVNDGDILFSWSASLEVIIWTGGIGGLNQHIFKVTSDEYPKSFIYFQLLNYLNRFRIIAENRKTTMGHITIDHLKQSEIYIPPKNIINKVDKTVSPIFSAIIKNRQESANLAHLRNFLLPLLMNGQVTVSNNVSKTETEAKVMQVVPATATNKQDNKDRVFKRLLLSAYLLDNICNEPTAGRVKFEKLLYLSEHCAQLPLQSEFQRAAAGPYDSKALYSLEEQLKKNKWFEKIFDGKKNSYVRLAKVNGYKQYYETVFSVEQKGIFDKLIRLLKKASTIQCEIIATLYGVWNDFLISDIQPTDEQIINDVLTNWHDAKKRIEHKRWLDALNWMKENDIIPIGYGVATK